MGRNLGLVIVEDKKQRFEFAIDNLISLYSFIAVLAIHQSMRAYVEYQGTLDFTDFPPTEAWIPFGLALAIIFRYFLGDLMYLRRYKATQEKLSAWDTLNLLVNVILLALLSFFVGDPNVLYRFFILLFFFELIWFFIRVFCSGLINADTPAPDGSTKWSIWGSSLFLLTIAYVCWYNVSNGGEQEWTFVSVISADFSRDNDWLFTWVTRIFFAELLLDILLRGPFYIGRTTITSMIGNRWRAVKKHIKED